MDWILFIFQRGKHFYLVSNGSEQKAWEELATKQSCSIKNVKLEYKLIKILNGNQGVIKL